MEFHNPYNFIPALPRGDGGGLMPPGLRDGEPVGHHRWHEDRYSGRIGVTITVRTPLLLMKEVDPPPGKTVPEGHRHLAVATTADNRVDLAPTQIKGMLRSGYEAVTNSRLGVFDQEERLGYRTAVDGGPDRLPALIMIKGDQTQLLVYVGGELPVHAKLPSWTADGKQTRTNPEGYEFLRKGGPVLAVVRRPKGSWIVEDLFDSATPPAEIPLEAGQRLVRGLPHLTGRSIATKQNEHLFINAVWQGNRWLAITPMRMPGEKTAELIEGYRELVAEQRSIHRHDRRSEILDRDGNAPPWRYLSDEPGRTAWSRHLYDLAEVADQPWDQPPWLRGDLSVPGPDDEPGSAGTRVVTCWAEIRTERRGKRRISLESVKPSDVERLTPVTTSRALHGSAPRDLLDSSLWPAVRLDQLSPADRVFGWVSQQGSEVEGPGGATAYRGHVRVLDVVAPAANKGSVHNLGAGGLTIAPLSTPKPSQGLFYVGDLVDGTVRPLGNVGDKAEFFPDGGKRGRRTLRGRKVFPHHRKWTGYDNEALRKALRYQPPTGQEEKTSQNATLHGWVKPGATFQAVIQVENLHPMELGALLWLLDPDRLGRDGMPGMMRLGMGKPLGFGSVEVRVDEAATRLSTGRQVADRYRTLADAPETTAWEHLAGDFEQEMRQGFGSVLTAIRNAAVGFPVDEPVHYPRSRSHDPGYEWFVANDRAMRAKDQRAQSLPALDETPVKRLRGY
jgi:CRISPR-associated protein (TIGR03986 family)